MDFLVAALLACLVATSSSYRPSEPREAYSGAPRRVYSKVSRPSTTHANAEAAHQSTYASHAAVSGAQQAHHGSALGSITAPQWNSHQVQAGLQASLGAAHLGLRGTQAEMQASLDAARASLQGTQAEIQGTLGAAHSSVQEARTEIQEAHAEAQASIADAYSSVQGARTELQEAQAEAQASLGVARSQVEETRTELQEARAEAQASLAAAETSVQEERARAQAIIGELAAFVSQSKFSSSTSYMLKKSFFTISRYFGHSGVRSPRIIVKDAALKDMVCVPKGSIKEFEVTTGDGASSGVEVLSGGEGAVGGIQATGREDFGKPGSEEFQKSVETIGQGLGIVVSVGGIAPTSVYDGRGATVSVGAGAGASTTSSGHGEFSSAQSGVITGHGAGSATSTVTSSGGPETSAGEYSGAHDAAHVSVEGHGTDAGYVQTSSGQGVAASAGDASASAGRVSGSAGTAASSTRFISASAGGTSPSAGGFSASSGTASSTSSHSTSGEHSETFSSGAESHRVTTGGDGYAHATSYGSGSSSAASVDSDGRVSLDVSGPHAEAAAVGTGASGVRLSGSGGLTYIGPDDCECVEDYLCDDDGYINTSGAGVINIRSFSLGGGTEAEADARCGAGRVCCRHREQRERVAWESYRCGTRSPYRLDRRVVSGEASRQGEFPWVVALKRVVSAGKVNRQEYLCGGSLIAPNIVLTGAHCVNKYRAGELVARVGEWDTKSDDPVYPHQDLGVAEIITHEQFDPKTLWYDVALLRLKTPAELMAHVNTICLPDGDGYNIDFSDCFATGWGRESFDNAVYSSLLKKVPLSTVETSQCESSLRETRLGRWFQLHETFLCAGGRPGVDVCQGDGGGSLVCRDTSPEHQDEETFVQTGIVAWGINCHRGGVPGVYADVIKLLPWIRRALSTLSGGAPEVTY